MVVTLSVSAQWAKLLLRCCFSHTEEQLVAKKHLNAVHPALDIRLIFHIA